MIGEFTFVRLHQKPHGMPIKHPLQEVYLEIQVEYYGLVVPERYKVRAGGKEGVAFWINNNGSGPSASVTSEMGRSNVAPLNWEGEKAVAKPYMEWRTEVVDGRPQMWCNARGHGFTGLDGRDSGYDWIDGTPTDLATMYDRSRGRTAQNIFVPKYYGIGTAGQTVPADALVDTYSILLYFPRPEAVEAAKKLAKFSSLMTPEQARNYRDPYYGGLRGGGYMSMGTKGGGLESLEGLEGMSKGLEPSFEVAHGHEMTQHVIAPPMLTNFWQPTPSAVLVLLPISEDQAAALNRPNVPEDRRGFGW